jgi:hypothetical protein
MSGTEVRGYTILKSAEFLARTAGEAEAKRLREGFTPGLQQALRTATVASWLPVSYVSEVFRGIASLGKGNEEQVKSDLVGCGQFLGEEATNTFLRLVMRMLTPALFAKKLPSFWSRDSTGGRYEVDVTDAKLTCRLREMEEFVHIAPVSLGYVSFALKTMGKTIEQSTLHGWSLAVPNGPDPWYELHWKK